MNFLTTKILDFEFLTENPLSFVTNTAFKDELFISSESYIKIRGPRGIL